MQELEEEKATMEKRWQLDLGPEQSNVFIETGRYAKQANGSLLMRWGDTVILVTATMSDPRPGVDFLPLMVNYEERVYAIGRIPGSWNRREGRPRDLATLNARLIDRPLRPLFPDGFRNDVQVITTVLSVDNDHEPEILALWGSSAALIISDIPFSTPVGGVKVGLIEDKFVLNPNEEQSKNSKLDLIVAGTKDAVTMVEAGAMEVSEQIMIEAIEFGHHYIKRQCALQEKMMSDCAVNKIQFETLGVDQELKEQVLAYQADLEKCLRDADKLSRQTAVDKLKEEVINILVPQLAEEGEEDAVEKEIKKEFEQMMKELVRNMIVKENYRPDGRKPHEVRELSAEVALLPRVHGSAVFQRGQTQAMSVMTLGAIGDGQILFDLGADETKRFMLHYNFPPYSVGETSPLRTPGRREIGHGALGERAIEAVLPSNDDFPYTIRVVSEILESNGSSSQASICASSLALMDGGVPLKSHVAGIAMGLIKEDHDFTVLTDIQGIEDYYGDMDFKVAGTAEGITALQMDMKISGIDSTILAKALAQAKEARLIILEKMSQAIPKARPEVSPLAPTMVTLQIDPEQIRDIIGPQGKTIRKITEESNTKIDIEDDGRLFILGYSKEDSDRAVAMIEELTKEVEVDAFYLGTVKKLMNFGAFVEILPGKEGLVHISKLAEKRVPSVEDVVSVGDKIWVKVTEIDDRDRINLSREAALKEKTAEELAQESRNPDPSAAKKNDHKPSRRNNRR